MALPTFRSLAARRQEQKKEQRPDRVKETDSSDGTVTPTRTPAVDIKKATSTRRHAIILSSFFFLVSVVFLILVNRSLFSHQASRANPPQQTIIGNLSNRSVLRDTYFFKLDLANIIPASTPADITFVNSLARSLGLHDFYQVGLWNFCEGYTDEGITSCSKPKNLYWFNPVEILLNELLAGATIALPADVNNILDLIRLASHFMFGCFLAGVCMNFVNIFITPVVLISRWWSFPIAVWTFLSALLTTAAAIIATVMFVIFRNVITSQAGLNIGGSLGIQMFAFMWVGAAFSIFGFVIHLGLSCCCASKRDVRTGRRKGNKRAYGDAILVEKKTPIAGRRRFRIPNLGRRKMAGEIV
ncbi:SUR7 family pun1 [Hyphodiscus hymeniophilus]|uniref:SUR7 family pun1 n=1 Tax=Hyphodiscus hymeniophilus TaxID=353542 RepID=A0A9P6VQ28_9HELO|nr:SUR7 family pun1 [Hyphodiscus hymeniophilus]